MRPFGYSEILRVSICTLKANCGGVFCDEVRHSRDADHTAAQKALTTMKTYKDSCCLCVLGGVFFWPHFFAFGVNQHTKRCRHRDTPHRIARDLIDFVVRHTNLIDFTVVVAPYRITRDLIDFVVGASKKAHDEVHAIVVVVVAHHTRSFRNKQNPTRRDES